MKKEEEEQGSSQWQKRQEDLQRGALSKGKATPTCPLETQGDFSALEPNSWPLEGNSIPERAQVSPKNLSCGSPATCSSHCPAQGVLTLLNAEGCLMQDKWAKESLDELDCPISPGS